MIRRELIDGHKVEVTDDGCLFVDGEEYTHRFREWPVSTFTFETAVRYHEDRHE